MTAPPVAPPDPCRCPLCGGDNRCAMEEERRTGKRQDPCWCTRMPIDASVLARVPAEAARKACICSRCASNAPAIR